MASEKLSTAPASAIITLELDPAPTCASDIWVDLLPDLTPEQYRTVRHFQTAEISARHRARTQHEDPKLRQSQYPDETSHQLLVEDAIPWLQERMSEPMVNLPAVQQLLEMAQEMAFITIMTAHHRNIYLHRYPFATETIESRRDHERWVLEAKQRAINWEQAVAMFAKQKGELISMPF
ncbi:unnamed protein product [Fusarium graminearum]|nr:unnamed protein product [Fusarium graminearum]CZS79422.1 unnamed protein product [Fusarium graminearum]